MIYCTVSLICDIIYTVRKMSKKILLITMIISSVFITSSCTGSTDRLEKGWQHNIQDGSTTERETVAILDELPEQKKSHVTFSVDKAQSLGMFELEEKGMISVFYQDGYLLLFDDFGDRFVEIAYESSSGSDNQISGEPLFTDMNFDRFTDMGIISTNDNKNTVYDCFIYVPEKEEYELNSELSSLCSPEFDPDSKTVTENKTSNGKTKKTVYSWTGNTIEEN